VKKLELKATEENIIESLENDAIGRNNEVFNFSELLSTLEGPYSVAIDSEWGSGKTFFVKQVKMLLDSLNPQSKVDKETSDKILKKFNLDKELNENSEKVDDSIYSIYFDAWKNDADDEPIKSLIYDIMLELNFKYNFSDTKLTDAGIRALKFLTPVIGGAVETGSKILDSLLSEEELKPFIKKKSFEKEIQNFISELPNERGNKLVIFIDELDRCNPAYAVKLLEQIKHYMEDDRIIFVFSVNINQLQHTIKHYYGNNFNATKYLDRFFDLQVKLPKANMMKFYENMGLNNSENYTINTVCVSIIETFDFSLREIVRLYQNVKVATENFKEDMYDSNSQEFLNYCIIPIIIATNLIDRDLYTNVIEGRNSEPISKVFSNLPENFLDNFLLEKDETSEDMNSDKFEKLYNAIFNSRELTKIGTLIFNKNAVNIIKNIDSRLSKKYKHK
jgi:hypothetical protein